MINRTSGNHKLRPVAKYSSTHEVETVRCGLVGPESICSREPSRRAIVPDTGAVVSRREL